jgi:sialate O-acetylesterase
VAALANVYNKKEIVAMGPLYDKMKLQQNKIVLSFKYTGKGLMSNDSNPLNNFAIAAADGKFVAATAVIKNNAVEVSAVGIDHPVAVRFGWNEANHSNLYNKDGLPALPFRTDNPIDKKFKD